MWQMAAEGQSDKWWLMVEVEMEQRGGIEFLHGEKMEPSDNHQHLLNADGDPPVDVKSHEWIGMNVTKWTKEMSSCSKTKVIWYLLGTRRSLKSLTTQAILWVDDISVVICWVVHFTSCSSVPLLLLQIFMSVACRLLFTGAKTHT